jgi:uncharacterized OB-fold protein
MNQFTTLSYDVDSQEWWAGVAERRLLVQRCDCGHLRWPARAICGRCGSLEWAWAEAAPTATVASWVVTYHQYFHAEVPYVVVLGRLDAQPDIYIPAGWAGSVDGRDLSIDQTIRVEFLDRREPREGHPSTVLRWCAH